MTITVMQLKRLIQEAVKNDKNSLKNKLIAELEDSYKDIDLQDEDDIYDILTAPFDEILNTQVEISISKAIEAALSEDEIAEIIENWQQEKIDELMKNFHDLPISTQEILQDLHSNVEIPDNSKQNKEISKSIKNVNVEIQNRLIQQLEDAFKNANKADEDEMHNILFEDVEFILSEFVDGDIEDEIRSKFTKKQIDALIETWQTQKIDMLLANINKMPKSLRLQLRGYV